MRRPLSLTLVLLLASSCGDSTSSGPDGSAGSTAGRAVAPPARVAVADRRWRSWCGRWRGRRHRLARPARRRGGIAGQAAAAARWCWRRGRARRQRRRRRGAAGGSGAGGTAARRQRRRGGRRRTAARRRRRAAGRGGSGGAAARPARRRRGGTGGGAAALDRFGVTMLRPTLAGGQTWVSKWDTGGARHVLAASTRRTPGSTPTTATPTYAVDGAGMLSISGSVPRMYIHDPARDTQWRDVEITMYFMRVDDSGTAYGGMVGIARTQPRHHRPRDGQPVRHARHRRAHALRRPHRLREGDQPPQLHGDLNRTQWRAACRATSGSATNTSSTTCPTAT